MLDVRYPTAVTTRFWARLNGSSTGRLNTFWVDALRFLALHQLSRTREKKGKWRRGDGSETVLGPMTSQKDCQQQVRAPRELHPSKRRASGENSSLHRALHSCAHWKTQASLRLRSPVARMRKGPQKNPRTCGNRGSVPMALQQQTC